MLVTHDASDEYEAVDASRFVVAHQAGEVLEDQPSAGLRVPRWSHAPGEPIQFDYGMRDICFSQLLPDFGREGGLSRPHGPRQQDGCRPTSHRATLGDLTRPLLSMQ